MEVNYQPRTQQQTCPPYRQIRALYDDSTITVYQAYNRIIAEAAVEAQRLNASPTYRAGRMTWIKPSWAWMMYRSGYSFKDPGQERILAITMKREHFIALLKRGVLTKKRRPPLEESSSPSSSSRANNSKNNDNTYSDANSSSSADVRIQWDPERTVRLEPLPYRSIQIGIPAALSSIWANEYITEIRDVTDRAQELKRVLEKRPGITAAELAELGLVPEERPFLVSDELAAILEMDVQV
ncbi:ATP-dependent RNA helicase [Hirsutella rhossiliensis]|uniref:ATP-dependent RNA helicase n=1 Tax=Hirsutella rhossiliensis TaxID=111463 RepID=A0A9P8N376_9HYPO|nr:ATP-dependent RNA helicase [Hirsutella rhossiliensis]KAH0966838.1 ATP-dependent RNA helicase [Hirsutella rhossiliensis]